MDAETAPRAFRTAGAFWLRDFKFHRSGLTVRATGAHVPFTPAVLAEVAAWFKYFFTVKAMTPIEGARPFTIAFTPERARPWYLIWPVVRAAGGRLVKDVATADIVMHFEDATFSPNPAPTNVRADALVLNFNCRDVSKTCVAGAFERSFGYPLAIDPINYVGPAVEKSEINGAHDGHIVTCPMQPSAKHTYQRLIDNRARNPDLVEDFRTPTVGGRPACVFIKRRPTQRRFANANTEVELIQPDNVFSPAELDQIAAFCRDLGLDWGGLDVLRDRSEGRLYIVDANKTDMGPPTALPLSEKMRATRMIASAFVDFVSRKGE